MSSRHHASPTQPVAISISFSRPPQIVCLVYLVYLVYLVCLVYLVGRVG